MEHWILIYSKPRQEQRAQEQLANQGYETFVPMHTSKKIRGGKNIQVTEPLFPRYLFLKVPANGNLATVRSTRGVAGIVRFGMNIANVPAMLISQLLNQQLIRAEHITEPFLPGQPLQILTGPFANLNAIYQQADGEHRSILLLNFLGQQQTIAIENSNLAKTA